MLLLLKVFLVVCNTQKIEELRAGFGPARTKPVIIYIIYCGIGC